jgi:hypothetical protein
MYQLTPEEERQARFAAEVEAGMWEPYVEWVEDTYSEADVLNHATPCDFVEIVELGRDTSYWIHGFRRPGCYAKRRRVVRYRRVQ